MNQGCIGALVADRLAPGLDKIIKPQKYVDLIKEEDLNRFKE